PPRARRGVAGRVPRARGDGAPCRDHVARHVVGRRAHRDARLRRPDPARHQRGRHAQGRRRRARLRVVADDCRSPHHRAAPACARCGPATLGGTLARWLAADRVIAVNPAIVDSIVRRAVTLVFDGLPDLTTDAFTWLSLGSNGRREAVLSSDVDAAVTFEDEYADDIPRYREAFGAVAEVLTRCGISVDTHRAFPMHQGFSRTDSQWRAEATGWLAQPRENQGMIMASLLVDARPIFGDPSLPEPARVFADFNRHPATMELLLYDSLARRAKLRSMRDKLA